MLVTVALAAGSPMDSEGSWSLHLGRQGLWADLSPLLPHAPRGGLEEAGWASRRAASPVAARLRAAGAMRGQAELPHSGADGSPLLDATRLLAIAPASSVAVSLTTRWDDAAPWTDATPRSSRTNWATPAPTTRFPSHWN